MNKIENIENNKRGNEDAREMPKQRRKYQRIKRMTDKNFFGIMFLFYLILFVNKYALTNFVQLTIGLGAFCGLFILSFLLFLTSKKDAINTKEVKKNE